MIICDNCGKPLPHDIYQQRHHSPGDKRWPQHIYCNRACRIEHDTRTGKYKQMSKVGREKRSQAVAASNHANPRRKRAAS